MTPSDIKQALEGGETGRELEELERLADAATPGPWDHWSDSECVHGIVAEDVVCQMAYLREDDHTHIPYDNAEANAAFIAAANPKTIKALITQLKAQAYRIEALEAGLKSIAYGRAGRKDPCGDGNTYILDGSEGPRFQKIAAELIKKGGGDE